MKKIIIPLLIAFFTFLHASGFSQNVVITDDPTYSAHSSAMLDVKSDTKGFLMSRADTASISNPAKGLMVYDSLAAKIYFFDGNLWVDLATISAGSNDSIWLENTVDNYVFLKDSTNKVGIGTSVPEGKLEVRGVDTQENQPLFVVKDDDGNEVFVVYSKGVIVYVDSADVSTKSTTNEQLTGFRVGKRTTGGSKGFDNEYFSISPSSEPEVINPSEARILWYPHKEAFMAGRVLVEHIDSVGTNSWASGFESKSIGNYSQALGYRTRAIGGYSAAIGNFALAEGNNSFAFGDGAKAKANDAYAFGTSAEASGIGSYALGAQGRDTLGAPTGIFTKAAGNYSVAIGQGALASGLNSVSFGIGSKASANNTLAIGLDADAQAPYSLAIGRKSTASGQHSIALGPFSEATELRASALFGGKARGADAIAIGGLVYADGTGAVAIGAYDGYYQTHATGDGSVAIGYNSSSGLYSFAAGFSSGATGDYSLALGTDGVHSEGKYSIAMGAFTRAISGYEMVVGRYNTIYTPTNNTGWNSNDRLFVIGNGTGHTARSDAMSVLKNGNVGINTSSPTQKLDVDGNARIRQIATGSGSALSVDANGVLLKTGSDKRLKENISPLENSLQKVRKLQGVSFTWINNPEAGNKIGFIAQEVNQILPELVFTNTTDGFMGINYAEMTAVLVEAIKEQQLIIEQQNILLEQYGSEIAAIKQLYLNLKAEQDNQAKAN